MLPTNVMSFMKKMVTNEQVGPGGTTDQGDSGTTLSKLRQTLSSSLNAAQDKVTKLNTASSRQCDIVTSLSETTLQDSSQTTSPLQSTISPPKSDKPAARLGNCRVCLKSFKPDDYSRVCYECHQKVCEDCASYSKLDENQDENTWRCSICRRKLQSRAQPVLSQNSTDSLLDVPVLEALQRRHSDVKIGSANSGAHPANQGLAPPRSPELRRHSDVSPASLKELEKAVQKVKSEQRGNLDWNQNNTPSINNNINVSHKKSSGSPGSTPRVPSPSVEKRSENNWDSRLKPSHLDADVEGDDHDDSDHKIRRGSKAGTTRRRKSRVVQKQHSYDDEIKNNNQAQSVNPQQAPPSHETSLGPSAQFSRRASAYDVFNRDSSASIIPPSQTRRSSCRQSTPADTEDISLLKSSVISEPSGPSLGLGLGLDEERRTRRRGSQLPDIAAIKAGLHQQRAGSDAILSNLPRGSVANIAAPRLQTEEQAAPVTPPVLRQPSVTAGEDIKIVIHDVDYESSFNNRQVSKRRVVLRRDVSDMAHRTRGFGMRVVGGKMGPDGRLFAYIVWTVPGGPAEKGGLQQGDKVLEWCGVGLTDRSFEEVCSIMDRTGDVAELLVEHGADLRMCDLLDEPTPGTVRKNSGDALGLQLVDGDGSPASPTRRKLPKTPV
ncbi:hypothetical protein M8J75_006040 [Diaphorina citri]|nr:hypothetical protein M8J75_006040 [Diaphorina citri]